MVQYPITNRCLKDVADFWIANIKITVWPMFVFLRLQIPIQFKNTLFKISLKFQNIFAFIFTFFEFCPCHKEVFWRDNKFKYISVDFHNYSIL